MYSRVPFLCKKVRHVGEVWDPTKDFPNATKAHLLLRANSTKDNGPFLMASFSSTPEMASSKTTSQAPRRRSPGLFTIFLKRSPEHQPPSQLGGHPPRVKSSQSLTRTNRNGELNTMQGCKARTPRKVLKILLSQIPPKQQMLG